MRWSVCLAHSSQRLLIFIISYWSRSWSWKLAHQANFISRARTRNRVRGVCLDRRRQSTKRVKTTTMSRVITRRTLCSRWTAVTTLMEGTRDIRSVAACSAIGQGPQPASTKPRLTTTQAMGQSTWRHLNFREPSMVTQL